MKKMKMGHNPNNDYQVSLTSVLTKTIEQPCKELQIFNYHAGLLFKVKGR